MLYTTALDQLKQQIVAARGTCEIDLSQAEHQVAVAGQAFGEAIGETPGHREQAASVITALLSLGTALGAAERAGHSFQGLADLTPAHSALLRGAAQALAKQLFDVTIQTTFS